MNETGKHHNLPPVILRRPSSSTVFTFRRQEELSSPQGNSVLCQHNVDETTTARSQQNGSPIEEVNSSNTCNSEYGHLQPCEPEVQNSQLSFEISTPVSVTESEMCNSNIAKSGKKSVDTARPTCLQVQTDGGLSVGNKFAACFLVKEGVQPEDIQQCASCPSTVTESVSTTPALHSNNAVLSSPEVTSTETSQRTPVFHVVQPQYYLNIKQTNKDAKCDLDIRNLSVDIPISDVPPTLQPGSTIRIAAENKTETTNCLSLFKVKEVHVSGVPVLQKCGNDEQTKITQSEEICEKAAACVILPEPAEIASQKNTDETVTSTQPEEIPNVFVQPQIIGVFSLRNLQEKNDKSPQYQCPKCLKRFHRILSQLEHKCNPQTPSVGSLHKLHSVKLYKCLECFEEFSDLNQKKSHACSSQVHAKSKNSDQTSSSNGKSSLKNATKNWCRTSRGSYMCNICKKMAFKESKIRVHCAQKHADHANRNIGTKIIKETKKTTSNNKSKKIKLRSSSNHCSTEERTGTQHHEHPFKCGLCGMRYKLVAYLKKHIALHMGSDLFKRSKRPYVCRLCKFRFHDSSTLKVHSRKKCIQTRNDAKEDEQDKRSSSGNEDIHVHKQNTCLVSKNAAMSTTSAEDSSSSLHNEKHFSKRKHRCGFCGVLCDSSTSLKKHVRTHWNQVFESYSRPLECCLCNEKFDNCVRFFLHVRRNSCSSTTTEDTSQSSATELSNDEARDEMECAPAMSKSSSASHQEEQPHLKGMHQCQFCNLNFWSKDILDIHLHSSHPVSLQTEETATSNSSDSEADRDSNDKNKDRGTPDPVVLNQQSEVKASHEIMQTQAHSYHHLKKASGIQDDQIPPTDESEKELRVSESNDLANHTFILDSTEREEDTEISKRTQIYPSHCKLCKIILSSWERVGTHCQRHHADHLYKHLNPGRSQPDCSMESSDDTKIDVVKVNLFHTCELCKRVFKYWKSLVFHQKLKHGVHVNCVRLSSRRQKGNDKGKLTDQPSLELNNSIFDNNTSSLTNEIRCESTQKLSTTQTLAGYSHDSNNLAAVQNENVPFSQDYQNCNQNQSQPSKKDSSVECRRTVEDLQITQVVSLKSGESNDLWSSINNTSSVKKDGPQYITEGTMQPLFDEVSSNHQVETHLESQRLESMKPKEMTSPDLPLHSSVSNKQHCNSSGCADTVDVQQAIFDEFKFLMNSVVTLQSTTNIKSNISGAAGVIPCDQYEFDGALRKIPFKEIKHILTKLERNCNTNAYHCSVCGEMLEDIPQYTSHILAHCDFEQYLCVFCGQRSLDIFSVLNHVVLTHRVDKVHVAQEPEVSVVRRAGTSSPTSTSDVHDAVACQPSTNASPQACQDSHEHCTYPRPRYDYMFKPKEHELNITLDKKTGQFKCPGCQFKYMDRADVIYHLRMYHNGRPYICKHCPEKFYFYPDVQAHFFKNHFLHVTQQGQHGESRHSALGGQCSQESRDITTLQPNFQSVANAGSCQTADFDGFREQKSCDDTTSDESEIITGCCKDVGSSPAFIHHIHTETKKQTDANTNPRDDERTRTQELQESTQDAPPSVVVKQEKLSDDVIDDYTYRNLHHHLKGQITIKTEKLDDDVYPTTECMQQTDTDDGIWHQPDIERDVEIDTENAVPTRITPRDQRVIPNAAASCLFSHENSSVKVTQSGNDLMILPGKIKVEKDVTEASQWGLQKEICNEVELSNASKSDSNDAVVSSSVRSETTLDISTKRNSLDSTESHVDDSHVEPINLSDVNNQLDDVEDILQIANEMGITLTESLPERQPTCSQKTNPGDCVKTSNRMITQSTEISGPGQTDKGQSPPPTGRLSQENNKLISDECRKLASPHTQSRETPQDHKESQMKNPLDTINPNPFHQNETISEILSDIAKNSFTSRILASFQEDSRTSEGTDLRPSSVSSGSNSALTVSTSLGSKRQLEPLQIPQQRERKKLRACDDNLKDLQAAVAEESGQVRGGTSRYELTLEDANEIVSRLDDFNNEVGTKECNMSQKNIENQQFLAAVPENTLQDSQRGVTRSSEINFSTHQSTYEHYLSNVEASTIHKNNFKLASKLPVNKHVNSKQQLDRAGNVTLAKQMSKRRRHVSGGGPLFRYHQVSSSRNPGNCNQSSDQVNNSSMTVTQGQSQDIQRSYSETLYAASINALEDQQRSNQSNQHPAQVQMDTPGYQQNHHSANSNQQNSCRYFEAQSKTPGNESRVHGQFAAPPRQQRSRSLTVRQLLSTPQSVNCPFNGNNPLSSADRLPDRSSYIMESNNVAFNNYTGPRGLCSNNINYSYDQSYSDVQRRNLHLQPAPNGIPNLTNNDYLRPVATCVQPVDSADWDVQLPVHPSYPQPLHTNNQPMVSPRDTDQRECMPKIVSVLSLHPDYFNRWSYL